MLPLVLVFGLIAVVNVARYRAYPDQPARWSLRDPIPASGTWIELSGVELHCNRLFAERRPGPKSSVLETFYVPATDAERSRVVLLEYSSQPDCSALKKTPVRGVWSFGCSSCTLEAYVSAVEEERGQWSNPVGVLETGRGPLQTAIWAFSFGLASALALLGMTWAFRKRREPSLF